MSDNMKLFLDKEYNKIYKKTYVNYTIGLKNLNEELSHKGLANSGISIDMTCDLIRKITMESIDKIEKLINEIQQKFNKKISKDEINHFIEKCIKTTNQHLDKEEKELCELFKRRFPKGLFQDEQITMKFNNLRGNVLTKFKDVSDSIVLINADKKIDINIKLSIASLIVGALSLIATIIFGVL